MKKINWRELGIDLAVDVAASIIIAVGIYNFAMSANFPVAGFSGIRIDRRSIRIAYRRESTLVVRPWSDVWKRRRRF